jgi:hypothetical protein
VLPHHRQVLHLAGEMAATVLGRMPIHMLLGLMQSIWTRWSCGALIIVKFFTWQVRAISAKCGHRVKFEISGEGDAKGSVATRERVCRRLFLSSACTCR